MFRNKSHIVKWDSQGDRTCFMSLQSHGFSLTLTHTHTAGRTVHTHCPAPDLSASVFLSLRLSLSSCQALPLQIQRYQTPVKNRGFKKKDSVCPNSFLCYRLVTMAVPLLTFKQTALLSTAQFSWASWQTPNVFFFLFFSANSNRLWFSGFLLNAMWELAVPQFTWRTFFSQTLPLLFHVGGQSFSAGSRKYVRIIFISRYWLCKFCD